MSRKVLVLALLCGYGFVKELRPITPFLTPYLITDRNLTDVTLYSSVYPFSTYSLLILTIPLLLLTDLLRFKPVMISEAAALLLCMALLTWGRSLAVMQLMQVAYGWGFAASVAYYAYPFAALDDRRDFQQVTSYARGSLLAGQFGSYAVAQMLRSLDLASYADVNYIGVAAMSAAVILAACLPSVKTTWQPAPPLTSDPSSPATPFLSVPPRSGVVGSLKTFLATVWAKLKASYSSPFVVKWSVWWALSTCGFLQVTNYIQNLWAEVNQEQGFDPGVYNGVTEAVNTLLGALAAFSVQFSRADWGLVGELTLGAMATLDAGLLVALALTSSRFVVYVFYVVYCVVYQLMITVATFNVGSCVDEASCGLIFGFNMFFALIVQTCLTFAVADENGFNLAIRHQFLVYGSYFALIAFVFSTMGCKQLALTGCKDFVRSLCRFGRPQGPDSQGPDVQGPDAQGLIPDSQGGGDKPVEDSESQSEPKDKGVA